jgi:hypothetical protein
VKTRLSGPAAFACAVALVAGACGSTAAIPSVGIPGVGGPTLAPGQTAVAGHVCDGYPLLNAQATVQPTIPVDSALLAEFICYSLGESGAAQYSQQSSVFGISLANLSLGSFEATINGNTVKVTAIRTPGQDAGQLVNNFGLFGTFLGVSVNGAGAADASVGGKNVKVVTDSDGTKSYFYAHGDTLWTFDNATDAEAQSILAALP